MPSWNYWADLALFLLTGTGVVLAVLTPQLLGAWGSFGGASVIALLALVAVLERRVLPNRVARARTEAEYKRRGRRVHKEFVELISRFSVEEPVTVKEAEMLAASEPLEKSIPELVSRSLNGIDQERRDALIVLWLTYRWLKLRSQPGADALGAFQILDSTLRSSFPSLKYSAKTKRLIIGFRKLTPDWMARPRLPTVASLLEGEMSTNDYREGLYDFLSKTGQQHLFETIRADRAEALRAVLIQLVAEGRLATHGLRKELVEKVQEEIRKKGFTSNVFLVFKNKFYELDRFLESLPHLKGGAVRPRGFGFGEKARIYQLILKTPGYYRDAEHFLDLEIRPRITSKEGFLAIIPGDLVGSRVFPEQKDFVGRQIVAANLELVNYLLTGFKQPDLDIWMLLAKHEVPVNEVLAALPLTILAMDLPETAAAELWSRYDELKGRFGIRSLLDWARANPNELATYLFENFDSLSAIFLEELEEKCERIVAEARRIHVSMLPQQLELIT